MVWVEKLDQRNAPNASSSRQGDFSRYHLVGSDTEEVRDEEINDPDPLDGLEAVLHTQSVDQPAVATDGDDADFLKVLSELSDNFVGEEAKGAPISDCLATSLMIAYGAVPWLIMSKPRLVSLKYPAMCLT